MTTGGGFPASMMLLTLYGGYQCTMWGYLCTMWGYLCTMWGYLCTMRDTCQKELQVEAENQEVEALSP
uniref:Uncharacterized protein n=1 Tax=Oncorhynchus tshawytscha TaxID=74940 RepID=A0AAZ3RE20_ONCTS